MNAITFYETSGQIVAFASGDAVMIESTKANTTDLYIDGRWNGETHYVHNGEPILRPVNTASLTNNVLSNLPVPCKIQINNMIYDCEDSTAELELPAHTLYKIKVTAFPFLDAEFTIEN
jgi:hypothetical protein